MTDEPIVTKTGKVLTDADMEALSREADIGYQQDEQGKWHSTEKGLLATTDAQVWAAEFCRIFDGYVIATEPTKIGSSGIVTYTPNIDVGTMISWFASAIETGRNAGRKETCLHPDVVTLADDLASCRACGTLFQGPPKEWPKPFVTYQNADGSQIYGEYSFVTELDWFDDREEEIRLVKRSYIPYAEEEVVLEDPYPPDDEVEGDDDNPDLRIVP